MQTLQEMGNYDLRSVLEERRMTKLSKHII